MRPKDKELAEELGTALESFVTNVHPLPGISAADSKQALIAQMLESLHRINYVPVILKREISEKRANPGSELFDPLKAAILKIRTGDIEEAFWLTFLYVHFGKNPKGGWRYVREIYGGRSDRVVWNWSAVSADCAAFRTWLDGNRAFLERKNPPGGFGNHRKYENLDAMGDNASGAAIASYVNWVAPPRSHQQMVAHAVAHTSGNKFNVFDYLFRSMEAVRRFGRTAKFDYLAMLGKLELAPIAPGSAYMTGATGPLFGARLLFHGGRNAGSVRELDTLLLRLDEYLKVGMQVIEDSLCNWQKSPRVFKAFRG